MVDLVEKGILVTFSFGFVGQIAQNWVCALFTKAIDAKLSVSSAD
jgi:hypothetical protein